MGARDGVKAYDVLDALHAEEARRRRRARADHTLDVGHAVLDTKGRAQHVIREGDVRADEGARGGADRDGEHGVAAEVRVVHARKAERRVDDAPEP